MFVNIFTYFIDVFKIRANYYIVLINVMRKAWLSSKVPLIMFLFEIKRISLY